MIKTHLHAGRPAAPLRLLIPFAKKPPTPLAIALAAWKTPMRKARSEGLYQKLKYLLTTARFNECYCSRSEAGKTGHRVATYKTHVGTTPLSGTPRKNLVTRRPEEFCVAPTQAAIPPKRTMMHGKKIFPENLDINRFDGIRSAVTMK